MAFVPVSGVSNGELIRTAWGTEVRNACNTELIRRDGAVAMTGPLLLPSTQSTNAVAATHKTYVDGRDALKLNLTGGTMTGPLYLDSPQVINNAAAVRYDYATSQFLQVDGDNWMTGSFHVGGNPFGENIAGSFVGNEGQICTQVTAAAGGTTNAANLILDRTGTGTNQPAADNGRYISFLRHGTQIGSITIDASVPEVDYNKTSDYRLKDVLGPVEDPLGIINALQTHHLAWKETGSEFDGFIAHEVQAVVPNAVSGAKDAVYPPDDPNDPGGIDPQQLDATNLIPYLVGAIQVLAARIEALEAP